MTDEGFVSDFGITPSHLEPTEHGPDARFELAAQLRRVNSAIVGRLIADEEIAAATEMVGQVADRLERAADPGKRPRSHPDPTGHPQDFFPTSPAIGFANPVAPPVLVEAGENGEIVGSAFFDYPYEGPPSCVHGGVIALVFDELLGSANIMAGSPAMTGTLTITYRKPTPLRTHLTLRARTTGRQGRKVKTWGGIYNDELLLAEAEGIFIELAPERFLRIIESSKET